MVENEWLALCVDALPEPYAFVITELYWHRSSLAKVGKELGLSKRSVARLRNEGLRLLQGIEGIEQWSRYLSVGPKVGPNET